MNIYISVDLEGISGVYCFNQTLYDPDNPEYRKACEYMMGDISAVVKGLLEGGARRIVVLDGHSRGTNIVPHLMENGAEYITGKPRMQLAEMNKDFDGVIFLGYHAMCNTPDGVLHHTQNMNSESRYWLNGREHGEMGLHAALIGHTYGVAPIMVSGDMATCKEAKDFFGNDIVAVATKKGLSREAAVLFPFGETRKALFDGAKKALSNIKNYKPYLPELPIAAKKEFIYINDTPREKKLLTREILLKKGFKTISDF